MLDWNNNIRYNTTKIVPRNEAVDPRGGDKNLNKNLPGVKYCLKQDKKAEFFWLVVFIAASLFTSRKEVWTAPFLCLNKFRNICAEE